MSDPLLRDIVLGDSEGTKFAILQRWLALLANNIGPVTPGGAFSSGFSNGFEIS